MPASQPRYQAPFSTAGREGAGAVRGHVWAPLPTLRLLSQHWGSWREGRACLSADTPLISAADPGGGPAAVCSALSWLNPKQMARGRLASSSVHTACRCRAAPTELAALPMEEPQTWPCLGCCFCRAVTRAGGEAGGAEAGNLPPHAHLLTAQVALPRRWRAPLPLSSPSHPTKASLSWFLSPPSPFPPPLPLPHCSPL